MVPVLATTEAMWVAESHQGVRESTSAVVTAPSASASPGPAEASSSPTPTISAYQQAAGAPA